MLRTVLYWNKCNKTLIPGIKCSQPSSLERKLMFRSHISWQTIIEIVPSTTKFVLLVLPLKRFFIKMKNWRILEDNNRSLGGSFPSIQGNFTTDDENGFCHYSFSLKEENSPLNFLFHSKVAFRFMLIACITCWIL